MNTPIYLTPRVFLSVLLIFLLALTACSSSDVTPETATQPIPPIEPTPIPEPIDPPETNEPEQPPVLEPEPEPENPVPADHPIRYRMNAVFDIVPIDDADPRIVLITIDDGPKHEDTLSPMLAALDEHEAKAIFFVNGYRVQSRPDLLTEIFDQGHAIGNHAWDHINLRHATEDEIQEQINRVQEIVIEITEQPPMFFRPPFGAGNSTVREQVASHQMLYMNWSNGSEDWNPQYQTPEKLIARVLEQLRPGSNILLHELPWTSEAFSDLLQAIVDEGYGFVNPFEIEVTPLEN